MTPPTAATDPELAGFPAILAQSSGLVTSGVGLPATEDGVIRVMLSAVLGGLGGVLGGLIVAQISRYLSFLLGRRLWVGRWVLIGALAGALTFGLRSLMFLAD